MNAGRLRRITFYLMVPVAVLLIIEGIFFFSASGFSTIEVLLCTLENTCMTFIARPTISLSTAFKVLSSDASAFERAMSLIYGFVVIIAPILTTTAVVAGLQAYILEFWYSFKFSLKDRMLIIGDGSMAKKIANKYAKKYDILYMMPNNTNSEARVPLLKNKIFAYPVEYKKITPYLESAKAEKASSIVISLKDYFGDYKTVFDTLEYMIKHKKGKTASIHIIDAPVTYREVFNCMYKGLCIKHNQSEDVLKIRFIDAKETNAQNFFTNPGFLNKPDKQHHIVLTGLGGYGRAMMNGIVKYMIDNGLYGTIDVFDRSLEKNISQLMFSADVSNNFDDFELIAPSKDARYSAKYNSKAGPIIGNFYSASAGELKYSQIIDNLYNEHKFDEVFFCIDDISVNFDCYRIFTYYAQSDDNMKLFFRAGHELEDSFEAIELVSDKIAHLPDGLPDVTLEA